MLVEEGERNAENDLFFRGGTVKGREREGERERRMREWKKRLMMLIVVVVMI